MQNSEKKLIKKLLEALKSAGVSDAPGWISEKRRELISARSASGVKRISQYYQVSHGRR